MRTQKKAKWEIALEEKRYQDSQDRARLDDLTHADAFKAFGKSSQPQAQHSPDCKGVPHYYDGALGYEAMKCDVCGYELDLNAEANAKATAERLASQPQAEHSPLPWMVWPNESKRDIYSTDGFKVATCLSRARPPSQSMQDAKLIVASVNHGPAAAGLAEALREIKRETDESRDFRSAAMCASIAHKALAAWGGTK